eukprot:scaffold86223_cov62-Phaeocystis_antarctica.AAC.3
MCGIVKAVACGRGVGDSSREAVEVVTGAGAARERGASGDVTEMLAFWSDVGSRRATPAGFVEWRRVIICTCLELGGTERERCPTKGRSPRRLLSRGAWASRRLGSVEA